MSRVGGNQRNSLKQVHTQQAWVALLPPDVEVQQKRKQGGEEGAARLFGRLVPPPSGALTLPDCFRGEQLGSKYTRRDFLTSGKRRQRAHNSDPPAHFLKELQTPKTAAACGGQTGSKPFGFTGSFPYYQLSGILKTHWRPPPPPHPRSVTCSCLTDIPTHH